MRAAHHAFSRRESRGPVHDLVESSRKWRLAKGENNLFARLSYFALFTSCDIIDKV